MGSQHDGRTEFVYLLQWPDRATLTDRWARFMADPEWAAIKKRTAAQHGQLVGDIEDRVCDGAGLLSDQGLSIMGTIMKYTGSCHCGDIAFEFEAALR